MDSIKSVIGIVPAALLVAFILYLPIMIFICRRHSKYPFARHAVNYAYLLYFVALIYIVFLWGGKQTNSMRSPNLVPLRRTLFTVYVSGGWLTASQFMLNMLLFVPFGLLTPIVFPRVMRLIVPLAITAAALSASIEAVQGILGRIGDIDDVIANTMGAVVGAGGFAALRLIFKKSKLLGKPPTRTVSAHAVFKLCLGCLLLLAPLFTDIWYRCSGHGFIGSLCLPEDTVVETVITDLPRTANIYALTEPNLSDVCDKLEAAFFPNGGNRHKNKWSDDAEFFITGGTVYASVYADGTWEASFANTGVETQKTAVEMQNEAALMMRAFLGSSERLYADVEATDTGCKITGRVVSPEDTRVTGAFTAMYDAEGRLRSMVSDIKHYHALYSETLMLPTEAIDYAKKFGYYLDDNGGVKAMSVSNIGLSYATQSYSHLLLPAYELTVTVTWNNGESDTWNTKISAVK